jgi:glutamate synthase (NADPH/NADH) large chain
MAHYDPTRAYRPRRPPTTVEDRDACALFARVAKDARPTHEAIEAALVALEKMLHRAGNLDGEGDGCGLLIDIPREIWAEAVRAGGHAADLALDPRFAVAHVFIPRTGDIAGAQDGARRLMSRLGMRVLAEREDVVASTALGPRAREEEPASS